MEVVEVQDVQVPALGFGTWQLRGEACRDGVHHALELGYRHVDTARMYRNEAEVGAGIADSDADRDEVFLVTKLPRGSLDRDSVAREIRHLGLSNFDVRGMVEATEHAAILTNQIEYNPGRPQDDILDAGLERDILITAYSPLDTGGLVGDDVLGEIGDDHGKTAEQVAIRWLLDQELVATIPRSSDPQHRQANVDVFDFSLTQGERDRIAQLGR